MNKKCKVVMLATKYTNKPYKESGIGILCSNGKIFTKEQWDNSNFKYDPQHLYITSDEEIKVGDWFYDTRDKIISNSSLTQSLFCKKIIATTDASLKFGEDIPGIVKFKSLPQPSQQFIQQYVEEYNKGNVITDVLVEYTDNGEEGWSGNNSDGEPIWNEKIELKVNPKDNTITIKKVKDSWTREEVIALHKLNCERLTNSYISSDIDWINENL